MSKDKNSTGSRNDSGNAPVLWIDAHVSKHAELISAIRLAGISVIHSTEKSDAMRKAAAHAPSLSVVVKEGLEQDCGEICNAIKSRRPDVVAAVFGRCGGVEETDICDAVIVPPDSVDEIAPQIKSLLRLAGRLRKLSSENELYKRSLTTDIATGALNRRGVLERLDQEYKLTMRGGEPFACLLARPDRNPARTGSRHTGDEDIVFRELARVIQATVRDSDVLGRLNNEELLAILPDTPGKGGRRAAERICAAVQSRLFSLNGKKVWSTVSVGVASTKDHRVASSTHLLQLSDRALSEARRLGGNTVVCAANNETSDNEAVTMASRAASLQPMARNALALVSKEMREPLRHALSATVSETVFPDSIEDLIGKISEKPPDAVIIEDAMAGASVGEACRKIRAASHSEYISILAIGSGEADTVPPGNEMPDEWVPREITAAQIGRRMKKLVRAKILQDALLNAKAQLRHAERSAVGGDRLRALGQIAGGVAHDFNNVLSAILGRTQILKNRNGSRADIRDLEIVEQAALDGAETIRRIQDFSRQHDSKRYENLDLRDVLNDCLLMTRARWKNEANSRGIGYAVTCKADAPLPVRGDAAELREVFINLLMNAFDAMPEGGKLTIASRIEYGQAVVHVADTGTGIAHKDLSRIFDPFFSTKSEKGTGLGLSVASGIVTRHGGMIDVQSEPGAGADFCVTIPLADAPENAAEDCESRDGDEAASLEEPAPNDPMSILVVDDEAIIRDVFRDILAETRHEVEVACSGEEALRKMASRGSYDVIITDLGMPGMSGWELAEKCRQLHPETKIVLASGWGCEVEPSAVEDKKVDHVLAKPVAISDLYALLEKIQRSRTSSALRESV